MKSKLPYLSLVTTLSIILGTPHVSAETVTFSSLLDEMTSRDGIASWPSPAYTCKQFSSYSRVANDRHDKESWFHNEDWSNYVGVEKVGDHYENVMMDAKGPGAIVRFWVTAGSPDIHQGTLRIYIDGAEKPVIEGKHGELISGGKLVGEPLSSSSAPGTGYNQRGHNLYLPIPYAKSCKVTYEHPSKEKVDHSKLYHYYNINYRTYAPGTKVESFTMEGLKKARAKVEQTQNTLADAGENSGILKVEQGLEGTLAAGQSKSIVLQAEGGGSIRGLAFSVDAENRQQALRSTVLEISFDRERTVWCPLGDFFGTGYQIRPTKFWYGSVDEGGLMQSHWVMPFEREADVTVHNLGNQDVDLQVAKVKTGDWNWDNRSMLFGVNWHQMTSVESGGTENHHGGRGAWDINYVTLKGQGVYVGDLLTLFDVAPQWWGEGDEKIFVDGEDFPSHFGTGTEDYYGYAWCRGAKFQTPFITQPDGTGDLGVGYVVNGRYRLLDGIPFSRSIEFDMEQWHWVKTFLDIAPTTYWYMRPGGKSNIEPDVEGATHAVALMPSDVSPPPVVDQDGKLEGERMLVTAKSGGQAEPQGLPGGWSGDSQLWWKNAKQGDTLELSFEAGKQWAGKRNVKLRLTQAVDYGRVAVSVNGKSVLPSFEGYDTELGATELKVPDCPIVEGANQITVKLIGQHQDAEPGMMFGLDYLQIH